MGVDQQPRAVAIEQTAQLIIQDRAPGRGAPQNYGWQPNAIEVSVPLHDLTMLLSPLLTSFQALGIRQCLSKLFFDGTFCHGSHLEVNAIFCILEELERRDSPPRGKPGTN